MANSLPIKTDTDLARYFSVSIGLAYNNAVEFSSVWPDLALVRFRHFLELMCSRLTPQNAPAKVPESLREHIDYLLDIRVISFGIKDACHRLRDLGNKGAHWQQPVQSDETAEDPEIRFQKQADHAREARDWALRVMEQIYMAETNSTNVPQYVREVVDDQYWKNLLYRAATDASPEIKYKAGLWYEAEEQRLERTHQEKPDAVKYDRTEHEKVFNQRTFLLRQAAACYQASYSDKPGYFVSNPDAMYRYGLLMRRGALRRDERDEPEFLILGAALAGHGEACNDYAKLKYDAGDYSEAERFWHRAVEKNITQAYCGLWKFYTDGKACIADPDRAIGYLRQGMDKGCPDCTCRLGQCYFEGSGVEKDMQQAIVLLERASDMGNTLAAHYLQMEVHGGRKRLLQEMEVFKLFHDRIQLNAYVNRQLASQSDSLPNPYKHLKIGANAPCPCQSGVKYKKCHGRHDR